MDNKFKVGDKVKHRNANTIITITGSESDTIVVGEFIDQYGAIVSGRFYVSDLVDESIKPTAYIVDI